VEARANITFAEHLLGTRPHDSTSARWVVTMAFCAGLHCLEAHLAGSGLHSSSQRERKVPAARLRSYPRTDVPDDL
jgi:hypothetical protein